MNDTSRTPRSHAATDPQGRRCRRPRRARLCRRRTVQFRAGCGRATPRWPKDAFQQKTEADAIKALYGKSGRSRPTRSSSTRRRSPRTARWCRSRSRARCRTSPASPSWCLENPNVLAAAYKIPAGTPASVANRLKMAKTTKVVAVVEAGGKLYSATKEVKVTVGGCGG